MVKWTFSLVAVALAFSASASWYWPFGSDDEKSADDKRLSELMEPASLLIDEATDYAADGKLNLAVEKYRAALTELEKVEQAHPDRAKLPEFASLRNKRAYVNAAIDTLLMTQAQENAKSVAVSDTTELERRFAEEKAGKASTNRLDKVAKSATNQVQKLKAEVKAQTKAPSAAKPKARRAPAVKAVPKRPSDRRGQILFDIANRDYASARKLIEQWLQETPNNAPALNLRAALEAEQGNFAAAEAALDQAINSNPRSHYAYYNMAQLLLERDAESKPVAKRYYETGRMVGGPVDEQLEAKFK